MLLWKVRRSQWRRAFLCCTIKCFRASLSLQVALILLIQTIPE